MTDNSSQYKILLVEDDENIAKLFTYNLKRAGYSVEHKINGKEGFNTVKAFKPDLIIISPGPGTPEDERFFGNCSSIIKKSGITIPILGICLGHQGIIYAFGGKIVRAGKLMHGKTCLIKHCGNGVLKNIRNPFRATRYHSLVGEKSSLPDCLEVTAESLDDGEIMGVRHKLYPIEGLQFHPESILTDNGKEIIKNFLNLKLKE